jgi:hypothetical protein
MRDERIYLLSLRAKRSELLQQSSLPHTRLAGELLNAFIPHRFRCRRCGIDKMQLCILYAARNHIERLCAFVVI